MIIDKNYCMSSFLTFRYVARDDLTFGDGIIHKGIEFIREDKKYGCSEAKEIDRNLRILLDKRDLSQAAILLSGGIDSGILASYMPKGTKAYTAMNSNPISEAEVKRAEKICEKCGLQHVVVSVTWDDYLECMDDLMQSDGCPVFANEPIVTVKAPIIEAQIIETILLSYLNAGIIHTTAARRVVEAADGIGIMEFGARRALGPDAAVEASKCAVIAGCVGTSNVLAGQEYGIPVLGTMAHSLVTEADSEYEAFLNYAKAYPNNCVLLVDTYDVLKSGVPNAIRVAKEFLIPNGYKLKGIRIDSGDLAYLSKEAKKMLVEAGLEDTKITLSNGLNEKTIKSLKEQGAVIDSIGLGDNIVLPDKARVGCVYKNVAVKQNGEFVSRIKVSNDAAKAITPGFSDSI